MPVKNASEIVVRGALQNVSQKYSNMEYIADRVFPTIDGLSTQTKVAKYSRGAWFRDEAEVRGPGAAARVGEFTIATQNLDPVNYAFAAVVTDEERRDARIAGNLPVQPDEDALEFIADKLDMRKEVRTRNEIQAVDWNGLGVGGEDANGAWGHATAASDTFLADMATGRSAIRKKTGKLPNTLLLDFATYSKLQFAPALQALIFPVAVRRGETPLTTDQIATLAQVDEVIVGVAIRTAVVEADGDDDSNFVGQDIWDGPNAGKGMGFLYYKPARPGLKVASPGYQYRVAQANGQGRQTMKWRESARHSDMYDTNENTDISAVGLDLGYLWKDTIAD